MQRVAPLALALVVSGAAGAQAQAAARVTASPAAPSSPYGGRIVVGPEILVSGDGDVPHVELMAASDPRDPRRLIGAAITGTKQFGGFANKVYASADGGYSWSDVDILEQHRQGSGDPQVAFGSTGTAYFTSLTNAFDAKSKRDRAGLFVYRSEDGGLTWGKPRELGFGYDHEQIAVDHGVGQYAGRVYLGALYGYPVYSVGIFRSADDGRSFVGPVEVANGKGEYGINVVNLLVLSDGTLFVPFADFEFKPERRKVNPDANFWFATSRDGGVTFSPAKKLFRQVRGTRDTFSLSTFPVFAVDDRSSAYRDRLYLTWTDFRTGRARLLFSVSSDRGDSWSEPRPLDDTAPNDADQFQPEMVVNSDGVVGVTWFDTRDASGPGRRPFHEYFTASLDGGRTFLPPRQISTAPSVALGAGNLRLYPSEFRYPADSLRVNLLSAADRWGNGGDYMGLAADADGTFHPWWADSRTGTFQIYTARVRVEKSGADAIQASRGTPYPEPQRAVLTTSVHLVFGAAMYDAATSTYQLPVRLRNDGTKPIQAPLIVTIDGFGNGIVGQTTDADFAPQVVNAANGKTGNGATFDYSHALGDLTTLDPGATTGVVVWRVRARDPLQLPNMHVSISGLLER